mmetsp:Transcript_53478/g.171371  ORF Transcript_53478/g.171371 Transcript_53478/m.171371 type:complete len:259 (-) Transcript_53478:106-882(-)
MSMVLLQGPTVQRSKHQGHSRPSLVRRRRFRKKPRRKKLELALPTSSEASASPATSSSTERTASSPCACSRRSGEPPGQRVSLSVYLKLKPLARRASASSPASTSASSVARKTRRRPGQSCVRLPMVSAKEKRTPSFSLSPCLTWMPAYGSGKGLRNAVSLGRKSLRRMSSGSSQELRGCQGRGGPQTALSQRTQVLWKSDARPAKGQPWAWPHHMSQSMPMSAWCQKGSSPQACQSAATSSLTTMRQRCLEAKMRTK